MNKHEYSVMIRYINSERFHAYTKDNLELSFKLSSGNNMVTDYPDKNVLL